MSKRATVECKGMSGKLLDTTGKKVYEPLSSETNITPAMIENIKWLLETEHLEGSLGLLSCTCDGKKTAAIVAVTKDGDSVTLVPIAIMATPEMELLDPDGKLAVPGNTAEA